MESPHLTIFLCLIAPLSMMLFVFKGRQRAIIGFLLTGIFLCLFAGEINSLIKNSSEMTLRFLTVNITPIVEEVLKAFPIVFIAMALKPDKQLLLESSIAVGVGFATMENACLLFGEAPFLSAGVVIARGLGAGMMHGVSALAVGYSMTKASAEKKQSYAGTVAAVSVSIIYHSIYNIMVQSAYPLIGILLPIASFIPLLFIMRSR